MEDENKSSRMRGWNRCTHKEGKLWEIDNREGGVLWWWRGRPGFLWSSRVFIFYLPRLVDSEQILILYQEVALNCVSQFQFNGKPNLDQHVVTNRMFWTNSETRCFCEYLQVFGQTIAPVI